MDLGYSQSSKRKLGLNASKYTILLTDIVDMRKLNVKHKEDISEEENARSLNKIDTDEYILSLLELTNLKNAPIPKVEKLSIKEFSNNDLLADCSNNYTMISSCNDVLNS